MFRKNIMGLVFAGISVFCAGKVSAASICSGGFVEVYQQDSLSGPTGPFVWECKQINPETGTCSCAAGCGVLLNDSGNLRMYRCEDYNTPAPKCAGGSYTEKYDFNHSTGAGYLECIATNPHTGACRCESGCRAYGPAAPGYPSAPPVTYTCR